MKTDSMPPNKAPAAAKRQFELGFGSTALEAGRERRCVVFMMNG
jgi:hypothetical protein